MSKPVKEFDFGTKYSELYDKATRISKLEQVYNEVKDKMQWNSMNFHSADEEHEDSWYTEPGPDDYGYDLYLAYQEVLEAIIKLANN